MTKAKWVTRYNTQRMTADMAKRGWNRVALAKHSGMAPQTVGRFLDGLVQTHPTAAKLAAALGYSVKRYFGGVERDEP